MSQHYFNTTYDGQPACIVLGWDRPIGHYFMFIERDTPTSTGQSRAMKDGEVSGRGEIIYSNLDEANGFQLTLEHFKNKLQELKLSVPAQMFEQVEKDRLHNTGNRYAWYEADGTFREHPPVPAAKHRPR